MPPSYIYLFTFDLILAGWRPSFAQDEYGKIATRAPRVSTGMLTDVGSSEFGWINGEALLAKRSAETGSFFTGATKDNTRNEHCVVLTSTGAWDLVDCDVPHYFMCEHKFKM